MVTAYPNEESRADAKNRGAAAYLAKPLGVTDLLHTFSSVLTN
jgi:hypothetical protein